MAFIDIFAPILLKLYEHIFDEKTLSNSQKVSGKSLRKKSITCSSISSALNKSS
jgi:hypothetical protein